MGRGRRVSARPDAEGGAEVPRKFGRVALRPWLQRGGAHGQRLERRVEASRRRGDEVASPVELVRKLLAQMEGGAGQGGRRRISSAPLSTVRRRPKGGRACWWLSMRPAGRGGRPIRRQVRVVGWGGWLEDRH